MRKIKIVKCSDSMMWYAKYVGREFELIRDFEGGYLSREPSGYTNIVRKEDAQIVD